MRSRFIPSAMAVMILISACNQKQTATSVSKPVSDLASENMHGNIAQVESDTYLIDSTGKAGPLDSKGIEKYDTSGYEISYVSMNGKDSIISQTIIKHNPDGFVTQVEITGANNEKENSFLINYDSLGKYSDVKMYDSAGKLATYYTDITSNNYGEITGAKGYHPDSTLKLSFQNYYDSIYNVGGISKDSVGKLTYSGIGVLNDQHNLSSYADTTINTDPKTKKDTTVITANTYTYEDLDSNQNWIQRTTFNEKGKPTKIVKRIITYRQ
jgi:hypothetical protein